LNNDSEESAALQSAYATNLHATIAPGCGRRATISGQTRMQQLLGTNDN
jgi:hypothetical protein